MKSIFSEAENERKKEHFLKALNLYEILIQKEPNNAFVYEGAGYCTYMLKNEEDALNLCNQALSLSPNLLLPYTIIAYIEITKGNFENAYSRAKSSLAINPESPDALCCYGTVLLFDKKIDDAIEYLTKAVQIDKYMFLAHQNLAAAYFQKKLFIKAATTSAQIFRIKPSLKNFVGLFFLFLNAYRFVGIVLFAMPMLTLVFNWQGFLIISAIVVLLYILSGYYLLKQKLRELARKQFLTALLLAIPTALIYFGLR